MIKKELACVRRLSPSSEQTQSSQCLHICRRLAASWDKLGGESAQGCWWLRSELTTIKVRSPSQSSSKVSSTVSASISRTCKAVHYPGSLSPVRPARGGILQSPVSTRPAPPSSRWNCVEDHSLVQFMAGAGPAQLDHASEPQPTRDSKGDDHGDCSSDGDRPRSGHCLSDAGWQTLG